MKDIVKKDKSFDAIVHDAGEGWSDKDFLNAGSKHLREGETKFDLYRETVVGEERRATNRGGPAPTDAGRAEARAKGVAIYEKSVDDAIARASRVTDAVKGEERLGGEITRLVENEGQIGWTKADFMPARWKGRGGFFFKETIRFGGGLFGRGWGGGYVVPRRAMLCIGAICRAMWMMWEDLVGFMLDC